MHSQFSTPIVSGGFVASQRVRGEAENRMLQWPTRNLLYICSLRYLIGDNLAGRKRLLLDQLLVQLGFGPAWPRPDWNTGGP